MIGQYLEQYTFEYLINKALDSVPDTIDKREGSIIYDALAPACYELAEYYMNLRRSITDSFAGTANGEYLELRVAEQGIKRQQATHAVKRASFTNNSDNAAIIPLGNRFSIVSDNPVTYEVIAVYTDENDNVIPGNYLLKCEQAGTTGNNYVGQLIPITPINDLKTAIMGDLIIAARDDETDEELRTRYMTAVNKKPFGGNHAQYNEILKNIEGVGDVQIYPTWNGGGTVLCSIVDAEFNAPSEVFIEMVQNIIDPEDETGNGLGMAPIGHKVTITAPTEVSINISANLVLANGFTLSQVETPVKQAISEYLQELRRAWGIEDELNRYSLAVYLARVNAVILSVKGVENITNTTINGISADLILQQTKDLQEVPIAGVVTLSD